MKRRCGLLWILLVCVGCSPRTPLDGLPSEESARPVGPSELPVNLAGVWEGYEWGKTIYKHEITFTLPAGADAPPGTYIWKIFLAKGVVKSPTAVTTGYTAYRWNLVNWYRGRWNLRPTPKTSTYDADRWTLHMTDEAASDSSRLGQGVIPMLFVLWGPDAVTIGRIVYLRRGGSPKRIVGNPVPVSSDAWLSQRQTIFD